jgi:NAD+ kinase/solute carrier family 25 oxoglutarate transporter 11
MDADVAHLERALEAVKSRSTRALANEESYLARIKELERMNRALVPQVASLGGESGGRFSPGISNNDGGGVEATYSFAATEPYGSSSREGSPRRMSRSSSYKTQRDKTNRLSVERIDVDVAGVARSSEKESSPSRDEGASPSASVNGSDHGGSGVPGDVPAIATELAAARLDEPDRETSEPSSSRRDAALRLRPRLAFSRVDSDASFDARETSNEFRETPSKSPFQLLLCNDDGCEVREPRDRAIRHRQHGTPHSQFAWVEPPRNALVVKKPNDKNTTTALVRVVDMLVKKNVTPWVEPAVHWETSVGHTWSLDDDPRLDKIIDFIVCLGGDGTILWVSNLFPKAVPPVISFAMGSLGFLTAFEEESIPRAVDDVVRGDFFFTPRSRLAAHVVDKDGLEEKLRYVCLNEVVIDRGASAALVDLDVNIDGSPMTKVLADGVMISTPTGSTAYSLAAGGSMVHPGVSGVLFVPICPHTLSFRPLVLPDTSVLTVRVPESARVEPVASFDGKRQRTLRRGESLVIAGWRYPVPAICKSGETGDWFRAVKDSLLWNVRGAAQKPERVGDARA